jgi:hypothetical protein
MLIAYVLVLAKTPDQKTIYQSGFWITGIAELINV